MRDSYEGNSDYCSYDMLTDRHSYLVWERERAAYHSEDEACRRILEISELLHDVINEELSETEAGVVKLYWFSQKSVGHIAQEMCVNRSTVTRILARSNEKIEKMLRYVFRYKNGKSNMEYLPIAIREAFAVSAAQQFLPVNIGERVKKMREMQSISREALQNSTGISLNNIADIEECRRVPEISEIVLLAGFFNKTTDYLIFGE